MTKTSLVALIDDHQATLDALSDLLDALQIPSLPFARAEDFLRHPSRPLVSCIILDINLGEMSGLELKGALNDLDDQTPVIFLTSMDDGLTRQRAAELGAACFLTKPVEGSRLVALLAEFA